jgi:hypothetical protein
MNEPQHHQHELGAEPAASDVAAGHELSDVSVRGLVTFLAGLVISLAVVVIAVAGMFVWLMRKADDADPPQPPLAELRAKQPPSPRLQASPAREMEVLARQQAALLEQTKRVDEQQKIVRIPIAQAMQIVTTRGLPDWPRVEPDTKQTPPEDNLQQKQGDDTPATDQSPDAKSQEKPDTEKSSDDKP